jgi:hypothetical protein
MLNGFQIFGSIIRYRIRAPGRMANPAAHQPAGLPYFGGTNEIRARTIWTND